MFHTPVCSPPPAGAATGQPLRPRRAAPALALLSWLSSAAWAQPPADPAVPNAEHVETSITIEGTQSREVLERRIRSYLTTITPSTLYESLARWSTPVCPGVAGLPQEQAEQVLARFSKVAHDAGVPLDSARCTPVNFMIVVTAEPDQLLKRWWQRYPWQFNTEHGENPLQRLLATPRPVRIWHNISDRCLFTEGSFSLPGLPPVRSCNRIGTSSRLRHEGGFTTRELTSALAVVDARQMNGIGLTALADYIALAGLAQLRENADPGDAPTILHLFDASAAARPQELSRWDQDFLNALYHTDNGLTMQLSQITGRLYQDLER